MWLPITADFDTFVYKKQLATFNDFLRKIFLVKRLPVDTGLIAFVNVKRKLQHNFNLWYTISVQSIDNNTMSAMLTSRSLY